MEIMFRNTKDAAPDNVSAKEDVSGARQHPHPGFDGQSQEEIPPAEASKEP